MMLGGLVSPPACAAFCAAEPVVSLETSAGAGGATLVPVRLNDTPEFVTLDTGAPTSVLRESIAEQLALPRKPIPLNAASGVSGRPFEESTTIESLGLGGTTIHSVPFLVAPRTHANDPQSAGLIGADVFSRFDLLLEFGRHRIAFYTPGGCVPDIRPIIVTIAPSRHIYLQLEIDDKRVSALLDSGASRSLMSLDTLHRLFTLDANSPGIMRFGSVVSPDGGSVAAYSHDFRNLSFGAFQLASVDVLLVPDETRRLHRVITPGKGEGEGLPDLVLGMPELERLQILVDYRASQLYVRPAEAVRR